jgi:hypothetical protein
MSWALLAWLAGGHPANAQDTPTPDPALVAPPLGAAPQPLPGGWISPTPDENGIIAVIVQPDESLWIIAARAGLTLPDLLALNNLTENDVIRPGDVIIIGTGTPPPTAISPELFTPTITPPPPTLRPTQPAPAATICLTAFEDANQNSIRDAGEPATPGVAFTVFNRDQVVANVITDGREEPHCVPDLIPGEYYVTRSILPGELLTTDGDWALVIADTSTLYQAFGSVRAAATPGTPGIAAPGTADSPASNATTSVNAPVGSDSSTPDAAQSATSGAETDPLLWGGMSLLLVGGLLLVAAVLILLIRRVRTDSQP